MNRTGWAASVAVRVATERDASRAGELGWWVLFVAIGAGTVAVLAFVVLVDRFAAMSATRRPPRGPVVVPRPDQVSHLPPPAGLSRAVAAPVEPAPAAQPSLTVTDAPHSGRSAPQARGWRPHVALPHIALPHIALPHVALPHVALPHVALPHVPVPHVSLRVPRVAGEPGFSRRAASVLRRLRSPAGTATIGVSADTRTALPPTQDRGDRRVRAVRVLASAAVPAALAGRVALDPGWLAGGSATAVVTGFALLVSAVGLTWLGYSTKRPFALRSGTRELVRTSQDLREARVEAAARLLADLDDDDGPASAWAAFGQETGLQIPRHMRRLISSRMDPAALVAYREAQSLETCPLERPLWVVTAVPVTTCLLPAVLMIAAA